MRHGRSKANEAGRIVSDPAEGTINWGLAPAGRDQVRSCSLKARETVLLNSDTIIITSDFLRASESASIAAEVLKAETPINEIRLRERFFGDYDGTEDSNYAKVWSSDEGNDYNKDRGVESPREVQDRIALLLADLEKQYRDHTILLVSHGDALQIAQTWFEGKPAHVHRSLQHLKTGEIRSI